MTVRYSYVAAKIAKTIGEVREAVSFLRREYSARPIVIHIKGAWAGCPKQVKLLPGEEFPADTTHLSKLLASLPEHKVVVVPIEEIIDVEEAAPP